MREKIIMKKNVLLLCCAILSSPLLQGKEKHTPMNDVYLVNTQTKMNNELNDSIPNIELYLFEYKNLNHLIYSIKLDTGIITAQAYPPFQIEKYNPNVISMQLNNYHVKKINTLLKAGFHIKNDAKELRYSPWTWGCTLIVNQDTLLKSPDFIFHANHNPEILSYFISIISPCEYMDWYSIHAYYEERYKYNKK